MVAVNPPHTSDSITLAIDEALYQQALIDELAQSGYHLLSVDVKTDIAKIASSPTIDAIITRASDPIKQIHGHISHKVRQSILFLIVPDDDVSPNLTEDLLDYVDAVLPAHPKYLGYQLQSLLALHRENLALRRQVTKLRDEIDTQKLKTTEIEVLKNAIVRNVSHELRTPLLHVKSAVALIAEDDADPKLISYAQKATAKLESHVQNITMLGHSTNIKLQPIVMRDVVEAARRNLARIWNRQDDMERITVSVEDNLPPVIADKQGLSIVIQLLLDNALKFGDNSPVEVMVEKREHTVYVAVKDNGIGIKEDDQSGIFDSFYQVDSSSTRRYGGTGVGLALVKLLLDYHKTEIKVASEIGKGSTFSFEIPYIDLDDLE